jgi:hypothetical protein
VRLPDGRLVFNSAGSGDVWVNKSGSSTGAWADQKTAIAPVARFVVINVARAYGQFLTGFCMSRLRSRRESVRS